jgi:hypothetical protein
MTINDITIVLVTSVLPSHPSTELIEKTIADIRVHLPNNEIIMQIDGLRNEQLDREADYNLYKEKMLWKCLHEYKNVLPVIFNSHSHQTTMMKQTIETIKTPLMLYIEGDAPLTPDCPIDWEKCIDLIETGQANTVRFHHEALIPEPHKHLMLSEIEDFTKTIQWSQRPHLSTKVYYRDIVLPNVPDNTFIEDHFHGVVQNDYNDDGMQGWFKHRLWIYTPHGNIKRSYHLDGRAGGLKYTDDDKVGL